jgi:branched-chain amino acid aminotransferase
MALHYAQSVFEGMKASKGSTPAVVSPRNARQTAEPFSNSPLYPPVPEDLFLNALHQLVALDSAWIPPLRSALYIRPLYSPPMNSSACAFGNLQVHYHHRACSPYYSRPVNLWAKAALRAGIEGGTGEARRPATMPLSLLPAKLAHKRI